MAAKTPALDDEIESGILDLLGRRRTDATICPSEVARLVASAHELAEWRPLMPEVRRVAARLASAGTIEVTQRGEVVSAVSAQGPIRLGLVR